MYGLWTGDRSVVLPPGKLKKSTMGNQVLISSKDGFKTVTIVHGLVTSVRTEIDHSEERLLASKDVTDEEVKQSLKALGIEASKARLQQMRDILEAAREEMKDSLDNVVTTIIVKMDGLQKRTP